MCIATGLVGGESLQAGDHNLYILQSHTDGKGLLWLEQPAALQD